MQLLVMDTAECVPHGVLLIWWYNTVVDLNAGRMARLAGNNDWLLICLLGSLRHGYLTNGRDFIPSWSQAPAYYSDINDLAPKLKLMSNVSFLKGYTMAKAQSLT